MKLKWEEEETENAWKNFLKKTCQAMLHSFTSKDIWRLMQHGLSKILANIREQSCNTESLFSQAIDHGCSAVLQSQVSSTDSLLQSIFSSCRIRHTFGRHMGDLTAVFPYLKGACKKEEEWLFTQGDSDRRRGNSFKIK